MKLPITIADVAREAQVSTQTVSRVLNGKGEISPATRQRVSEVIERLGYRPNSVARGLVTNRTLTLGLVVPDIANPFFPEIARGVEEVVIQQGYNVFLCNTIEDPEREETILKLLEDRRVDGVILCGSRLPDERLLPLLQRHQAVVQVNRPALPDLAGAVRVDDAVGTEQALIHLLQRHRQKIGFLAGPLASRSSQIRTQAFITTLAKAGSAHKEGTISPCLPTVEGGQEAALALLDRFPEIEALLCYNDLVAIGALQACVEHGVDVPDRVAVIGCDDIFLAGLVTPALTTLRVSKTAIGVQAATMLLDRIAGHNEPAEVVLTPELVVRASAP
jgi:LacI family transcriptional regulator